MKHVTAETDRGPVISAAIALSAATVLLLAVPLGLPVFELSVLVAGIVVATLAYRTLLQWHALLAFTILVIFLIPIKRYALPGNLPFELEPYRLVVMLILAAWVTSLLIDARVRLRKSGFEGPMFVIGTATVVSVLANPERVNDVQAEVVKGLMFLASFFLVFYLIVSVVRTRKQIDFVAKALVVSGVIVAVFAVIESRTAYNAFDHLGGALPFLVDAGGRTGELDTRGGNIRVYGSAQSPIAMGAAFAMLIPLALYLAGRTGNRLWWVAVTALGLATLSTVTRTGVVMLLPLGLVFAWLRWREVKRLWWAALPLVCLIYFALPGTLGTIRGAFFPAGGLIAEQQKHAGAAGSGRIADLDPALAEWSQRPVFGQGYSTRQTGRENRTAQILDNQWLKTLLETGIVGAFGWAWLYLRFIRKLGAEAKRDLADRGLLIVGLTASVAAFAVGMFFFDAFSFIQVTFVLFILLALGASTLATPRPARKRRVRGSP
jgi:polysaccharide biosynthesis protein PslJ